MTELPIDSLRGELRQALIQTNRLILSAPTGSGKSTRIPQMLVEDVFPDGGQILILQPRRLAARLLAARVAQERGGRLGEEVGYHIRFERVFGRQTRILFITEGILLRRLLEHPELPGVAAVILDEFHERHLYGDISLARMLDLQEQSRPELRVIVMSATLDRSGLQEYMGPTAQILESAGRVFPVDIQHVPQNPGPEPIWETAASAVARAFPGSSGHALVFMPGAYEIARTLSALRAEFGGEVPLLPLHGELPPAEQDRAVASGGPRRIIVSTNVAETSLTIDGVTLVVDSGLARVARFDPQRGIDTLLVEKISRAAAEQRAGRAGRTAPGVCVRLWTAYEHQRRAERELPEVHRLDLAETVLTLKACGVGPLEKFRWFDPPAPEALAQAVLLLTDLGALDASGNITDIGRRMLPFPVHPRYARLFLEAEQRGCVAAAARIAALTQTRNVLTKVDARTAEDREELFGGGDSDFLFLFRAVEFAKQKGFRADACRPRGVHGEAARQAVRLEEQFLDIARGQGLTLDGSPTVPAEESALAKCLLAAFADRVARRRSAGNYQCDLVHGRRALLPKSSEAAGSWLVVAAEVNEIGKGVGHSEVQLGLATAIEESWLEEVFPEDFSERRTLLFDATQNRVVERRETVYRDLVLRSSDRDARPDPEVAACLAAVLRERGPALVGWGEDEENYLARINFVARHFPETGIQAVGAEERELLLEQFCEGSTCLRDLKEKSFRPTLKAWMRPDQAAALERLAPERIALPGGKSARVQYGAEDARVAVRIQELFGVQGGLTLGGGRVTVLIEVLAPNHRPVQITKNLTTFWQETYPQIKPQLQRRYPKHRWD